MRPIRIQDWPTIFHLAAQKHRTAGPDKTTCDSLTRRGLAITKRNASLYNLGLLPAMLSLVGLILLCLTRGPYALAQLVDATPFGLSLLEVIAPLLVMGAFIFAVRHSLPALALGLRHGMLYTLVLYVPTFLLIILGAPALVHDHRPYSAGDFDWWGWGGWSAAILLYLTMFLYLVWPSLRRKETVRTKQRSISVIIVSTCWASIAIMALTAHNGRVLMYVVNLLKQWV